LIPAVGDVLRCPCCDDERPFFKPPLLIVAGAPGIGKSTLCARLAGTIPGAVLLDADIAENHISVVSPNQDYVAFWRSMLQLAHELSQNDIYVVYFATMLPQQILANGDEVKYFESVQFLCLNCPTNVLRFRLERRIRSGAGSDPVTASITRWTDFNDELLAAALETPHTTVIDASRSTDAIEQDVREWINARVISN
jgi:predicted ABC-type ATPase